MSRRTRLLALATATVSFFISTPSFALGEFLGCWNTPPSGRCQSGERAVVDLSNSNCSEPQDGNFTSITQPRNYVCAPYTGEGASSSGDSVPPPANPEPVATATAPIVPTPPPTAACTTSPAYHQAKAAEAQMYFDNHCRPFTAEDIANNSENLDQCSIFAAGHPNQVLRSLRCVPFCAENDSNAPCSRPARDLLYQAAESPTAQATLRTEFFQSLQEGDPSFLARFETFKRKIYAMETIFDDLGPRSSWPEWIRNIRPHVDRAHRRINLFERQLNALRNAPNPVSIDRIMAFWQQIDYLERGCQTALDQPDQVNSPCGPNGTHRETRERGNLLQIVGLIPEEIPAAEGESEALQTAARMGRELRTAASAMNQALTSRSTEEYDPAHFRERFQELHQARFCYREKQRAANERLLAARPLCRSTHVSGGDANPNPNPATGGSGTPPVGGGAGGGGG